MNSSFGEKVHMLRKEKNISLDEMAYDIGISKSTLSKYERDLVDPTLDSAKKLSDYFMVSLDWLSKEKNDEQIKLTIPDSYIKVIEKAISYNVSSETLNDALNLILKVR